MTTTILGLDISSSSPGACFLTLDEHYVITKLEFRGIAHKKKLESKELKYFSNDFFHDYIDKYSYYSDHLLGDFLGNINYAAIEDYAFAAVGRISLLSEVAGHYKNMLYHTGAKIRMYAPVSWKKVFTGTGHADKLTIYEQGYKKQIDKLNIPDFVEKEMLPIPESGKGIAPTSDLLDALGLAVTMRKELILREILFKIRCGKDEGIGVSQLEGELEATPENIKEVFKINKKSKPKDFEDSFLNRDFLEKTGHGP